jgi:ABC-type lipoprotein release transport system permease subunit
MTFNVSPLDPGILAGACALLCAAGLIACVMPAWRAASVDPAVALRIE